MFLIGVSGVARSGKDTVANYLIKKYNLLRYGPSVRVKDTTAVMFDVPRAYLDDETKKDTVDPFWGITYRMMMQKVGKESSRDIFGDDIWMRHVEKKLKEHTMNTKNGVLTYTGLYNGIILPDIRYANEIQWLHQHEGIVIFVQRNNLPEIRGYENHPGEQGLNVELADIMIYNNGTIEEMYEDIDKQLSTFQFK
jgi:hypothetical protein